VRGDYTARISIAHDDDDGAEAPFVFAIRGKAIASEITLSGNGIAIVDGDDAPREEDFTHLGEADFNGGILDRQFIISNIGELPLDLTGAPLIVITGDHAADFSVSVEPETPLAPFVGQSAFTIHFDPSVVGDRRARIEIVSDDPNHPLFHFAIRGYGYDIAKIALSGNDIAIANGDEAPAPEDGTDFGACDIGAGYRDRSFTIHNTNYGPLYLPGYPPIQFEGEHASEFELISAPDSPVSPMNSSQFTVRFDPAEPGRRMARIVIPNNDPGPSRNPFVFAIAGEGALAPEIETRGNDREIMTGDDTPSTDDHTDFGAVEVRDGVAERVFAIHNLGGAPLELTGLPPITLEGSAAFTIAAQPTNPIAPGDSTSFTLHFDPDAKENFQSRVIIANTDNDENPYSFTIAGEGSGDGALIVRGLGHAIANGDDTPAAEDGTDFGYALAGQERVSHRFFLENTGTAPLRLNMPPYIFLRGENRVDFRIYPDSAPAGSLAPGAIDSFTVAFAPLAGGRRVAELQIFSNDPAAGAYRFALAGEGTFLPDIQIAGKGNRIIATGDTIPSYSDGSDFGAADVDSGYTERTFTIQNQGAGPLILSRIRLEGDSSENFALIGRPDSLVPAGGASTFILSFDPTGRGLHTASIIVESNDPDENPYHFAIQGTGKGRPAIALSGQGSAIAHADREPSAIDGTDFGAAMIAIQPISRRFVIHNQGDEPLILSRSPVRIRGAGAGDFKLETASPPAGTIEPGQTDSFAITFNPQSSGDRRAEIQIASNDPAIPLYIFAIAGVGRTPPDIHVAGSGNRHIPNGDDTPTPADGTDFGQTNLSGEEKQTLFTLFNLGES